MGKQIVSPGVLKDIAAKADKVSSATSGNVAKLDSNGNLEDSGYTLGTSVPSNAVFTDTVTEVVDDLTTDSSTKALSAAQGKILGSKLITVTSGSMHDIKASGAYYLLNAVTDKPTSTGGSYVVGSNGTVVSGIFTQNSTGNTYVVRYDGSTWAYAQLALNSNLTNHTIADRYTATSFTAMKDYLISVSGNMENGEILPIRILANFSNTDVIKGYYEYSGTLMRMAASHFQARLSTDDGLSVLFAYSNGTWVTDSFALNSNTKKVHYYDYNIELTSSSGRTVSVTATIAGYLLIGATFVQNDDLYYLTTTDGIYPNLSVVDGTVQYIQLLGMNKSFAQVGANRTIKVRALYTKL